MINSCKDEISQEAAQTQGVEIMHKKSKFLWQNKYEPRKEKQLGGLCDLGLSEGLCYPKGGGEKGGGRFLGKHKKGIPLVD